LNLSNGKEILGPLTAGIHCSCYCPYLIDNGQDNDIGEAKCALTGNELMWHDYWIGDCKGEEDALYTNG